MKEFLGKRLTMPKLRTRAKPLTSMGQPLASTLSRLLWEELFRIQNNYVFCVRNEMKAVAGSAASRDPVTKSRDAALRLPPP